METINKEEKIWKMEKELARLIILACFNKRYVRDLRQLRKELEKLKRG